MCRPVYGEMVPSPVANSGVEGPHARAVCSPVQCVRANYRRLETAIVSASTPDAQPLSCWRHTHHTYPPLSRPPARRSNCLPATVFTPPPHAASSAPFLHSGLTPLMLAAVHKHADCVAVLMRLGANCFALDHLGRGALVSAIQLSRGVFLSKPFRAQ